MIKFTRKISDLRASINNSDTSSVILSDPFSGLQLKIKIHDGAYRVYRVYMSRERSELFVAGSLVEVRNRIAGLVYFIEETRFRNQCYSSGLLFVGVRTDSQTLIEISYKLEVFEKPFSECTIDDFQRTRKSLENPLADTEKLHAVVTYGPVEYSVYMYFYEETAICVVDTNTIVFYIPDISTVVSMVEDGGRYSLVYSSDEFRKVYVSSLI